MLPRWISVIVVGVTLVQGQTRSRLLLACDVNRELCYTVHMDRQLNQTDAAEECRRQHVNGRLVTFESRPTQRLVDEAIGQITSVSLDEYWIGARLRHLDKWTWVNDVTYEDNEWLQFPKHIRKQCFGYISLNKILQQKPQGTGYGYFLGMNVIGYSDPSSKERSSQALCQRMKGRKATTAYENRSATRWNEARNVCTRTDEWDLAVLSDVSSEHIHEFMTHMKQNSEYFIGLSNVRLTWNMPGFQVEVASYTNWGPGAPHDFGNNSCVYASRKNNWQWFTSPCNAKRTFVCVHDDTRRTAAHDTVDDNSSHETCIAVVAGVLGVLVGVIVLSIACGIGVVCRLQNKSMLQANQHIHTSEECVDDSQYDEIADVILQTSDEVGLPNCHYAKVTGNPWWTDYEILHSKVNKNAKRQQNYSVNSASVQTILCLGNKVVDKQANKLAKTPTAESQQYANIQISESAGMMSAGGASCTTNAAVYGHDICGDYGHTNLEQSDGAPNGNTGEYSESKTYNSLSIYCSID